MKRPIKIVATAAFTVVIVLVIVNQALWAKSYSYACWRVTHPFGPDTKAFVLVVSKTEPRRIPDLITKLDGPDGWWIESMFEAWFPEAQAPDTGKQAYWNKWWKDHHREYGSSLVLHHDPQF